MWIGPCSTAKGGVIGRHWKDVCVWRRHLRGRDEDGSKGEDPEWHAPLTTWSYSCFSGSLIVCWSCLTHSISAWTSLSSHCSTSVSWRAALISCSRSTYFDTKASSCPVWKDTLACSNDMVSSLWCFIQSLQSLHLLWRTVQSSRLHFHLWFPSSWIDPSWLMVGFMGVRQQTIVSREREDGGPEVGVASSTRAPRSQLQTRNSKTTWPWEHITWPYTWLITWPLHHSYITWLISTWPWEPTTPWPWEENTWPIKELVINNVTWQDALWTRV